MAEGRNDAIQRVSWITIVVNTLLSACKLIAGIVAGSGAMISDAVHTLSDVFSTFIVIIGVRLAGRKRDTDHNYGHEKFESIAGILLAVMLAGVALMIGYKGMMDIGRALRGELEAPGILAAIAAGASIAVKEWMYHYTLKVAKLHQSPALKADAWHHRSDALSSIGALIGIAGAMLGLRVLEPVASIVICVFILKVSVDIFRESTGQLTDRAADDETRDALFAMMTDFPGVIHVDDLKTRVHGARLYIDVEIAVDPAISVDEGHEIATSLHNAVEASTERVKHINVHVNPAVLQARGH